MSSLTPGMPIDLWCVERTWFTQAMEIYQRERATSQGSPSQTPSPRMVKAEGAIAVIPLKGPLVKEHSFFSWFFGGTSTTEARSALDAAAQDPQVSGILLHIDSPGGQVAGTDALAAAVRKATHAKPVWAHIDDLGASAAMWIASQGDYIFANPTAEIGSIGTMAVLSDTSRLAAREGITVHVVATGHLKGFGVPGTALSEAGLADLQDRVEAMNAHFLKALRIGREMTAAQLTAVSDGRLMIAHQAKRVKLIDEVAHFPSTLTQLRQEICVQRAVVAMLASAGRRLVKA